MLDSGATESFIHPRLIKEAKLKKNPLMKLRKVKNVNGTLNKAGAVTHMTMFKVRYQGKETCHKFLIADIGEDDIILGYPFFEGTNPNIDWTKGTIDGMVELKGMIEDSSWIKTLLGKTTVAQQLAEAATEKKKKTWDELVLKQYHDLEKVFFKVASERFPEWQHYDHAIDLVPEAPTSIDCRVYPLSPKEKEEQKEFLATSLWLNRIRQSNSPYASRFFLICKKDGKFRPVQDYQQLNKWTISNKYPLSLITELIHDLAGKQLFSKFDVRWGYNNVRIKEGDKWKAAFKTSEGLFKPTVMFFGLTNSLATFQSMMDDIFQEEIAQGWLRIYMDDAIIAMEDNPEEHTVKVHHFLSKLQKHNLFLKPEKCRFHQKEVEYLGVIIGQGAVKMDPVKVEGIAHWPTPATVKDVRSFLGFCNFYHTFIPHFSNVA